MRLGTLARKINITPSALTNFLTKEEIELASGTNTKLSNEHIDLVLGHFKKTIPEDPIIEETPTVEPTVVDNTPEREPVETESNPIEAEIPSEEVLESAEIKKSTPDETSEIIEEQSEPEIEEIEITGSLTLDSKGNALVDFNDSIFNGKIRIVGEASYQSIYENYDAYLSIKNVNDTECKISVYGHYTLPVDSTNWAHDRRDFHAHQISFGF